MHQTSVHVYRNAGEEKRNEINIEVRIDERVTNDQQVRDLGIGEGDFVSFDPRVQLTKSGFIKSRHLDDKASVGILLSLIHHIVKEKIKLPTYHAFPNLK